MSTSEELVRTVISELSTHEADKQGAEEVLRRARIAAEISAKERGKKIKDMPSREYLLLAQLNYAARAERMTGDGFARLLSTTITSEHPPCNLELKDAKAIQIKDLRAEQLHFDSYIVFRYLKPSPAFHSSNRKRLTSSTRTISVPVRQAPLIVVAEDHAGDATMVTLYNINIDGGDDQRFMPVNTYFIVRAPLYKMSGLGVYALRVDHPSDCIRVCPGHPEAIRSVWARPEYNARHVETDANKLKEEGGKLFAAGKFQAALDTYNMALERIPFNHQCDMWLKLFCNRVVTHLKMGRYEGVLGDTTFLLPVYPDTRRPLFLQARAYYNLRDFEAARKAWVAYLSFAPNEKDGQKHMKMTMTRLDEEKKGNYNFKQMSTDATQSKFPRLDYADYLAAVEVKNSKLVKGQRGLFARQDFKQGDLVLCEKAFRICYKDEIINQTTINTVRNRFYKGPESRLPSMVTQFLFDNPSLAPRFLNLYCCRKPIGTGLSPALRDGEPLIDAFTVSSILESNAFKVERVARRLGGAGIVETDSKTIGSDTGIWIEASYINHSCLANVSRSFVGDMMVIRAQRAIKKGEELLHTYVPAHNTAEQKKKAFKAMGFTCKCDVCKVQNGVTERERQQRQKAMEQFDKLLQRTIDNGKVPTQPLVNDLRGIINKLIESHTKREYCFDLIKPYEMLFGMNYYLKKYSDCIKDLRHMLRLISGTDIGDFDSFEPKVWFNDILTIMVQFCLVFKDMGDNVRAEKCKKITRMLYGNQTGLGFDLSPYEMILGRFKSYPLK